jgi:hypothetical protein
MVRLITATNDQQAPPIRELFREYLVWAASVGAGTRTLVHDIR